MRLSFGLEVGHRRSMRAAIVLAAGKGTRLKSRIPKVLHPVAGQPMVQTAVERARQAGLDAVVVVVGHGAEAVQATVEAVFPNVCRFALQTEQRGTGHAARIGLQALPPQTEGRVLILSADAPLLRQQTVDRLVNGGTTVRFLTAEVPEPRGYGRVVRDADGRVQRIVEEKDATEGERAIREVNAGTYWVDLGFLREAVAGLETDNAQGELYLTDVVETAARRGEAEALRVDDPTEIRGVNDRTELAEAERIVYSREVRRHQVQGVTVNDPASVRIDPGVIIGPDTVVEPRVTIRGASTLGAGCRVDVGSVLEDAEIEDGVTVHPYTVVEGATLRTGSVAGPFARLRPGTVLQPEARVGNFVELKKTTLGPGAKANHLSYLGDAQVGRGANIGAGTITCNYDGFGKYPTRIGDGAFVGSNATLVAPLDIGTGAYVAAGSALTDPVPDDGLAFGRARQTVKPERARAVREAAQKRAQRGKD